MSNKGLSDNELDAIAGYIEPPFTADDLEKDLNAIKVELYTANSHLHDISRAVHAIALAALVFAAIYAWKSWS